MTSAREGIIALAEALEELTKADEKEQAEGHQRWWKPLENMLRGYKSKHEAMAHRANGKYDALISMADGLSAYGLLAEDFQVGIFVCSFLFCRRPKYQKFKHHQNIKIAVDADFCDQGVNFQNVLEFWSLENSGQISTSQNLSNFRQHLETFR